MGINSDGGFIDHDRVTFGNTTLELQKPDWSDKIDIVLITTGADAPALSLVIDTKTGDVTGTAYGRNAQALSVITTAAAQKSLEPGDKADDGSIFVGDVNGYSIFAAPYDLTNERADHMTLTFNKASEAVADLNSKKYLGHDDWMIPGREAMAAVLQITDKGALKDTFGKWAAQSANDQPNHYWTTASVTNPDAAVGLDLNGRKELWSEKNTKTESTRPVRLVPKA